MRGGKAATACIALLVFSAGPAAADYGGEVAQEGVQTSVTNAGLDRAKHGLDIWTGAADKRTFAYASVYA